MSYLPTYLFTYHLSTYVLPTYSPTIYLFVLPTYFLLTCLPSYLPTIYLPIIYLPTYLFIYLLTYYLPTYLSISLATYLLSSYLPIYLSNYLLISTYLPTYEKNWNSNVVLHIDKKLHGSSKKYVKCICYHIVLQSGGVVWWLRHQCGGKEKQGSIPFTNIYYMEYVYS
jgi:hypothetical protein